MTPKISKIYDFATYREQAKPRLRRRIIEWCIVFAYLEAFFIWFWWVATL